MSDAEQEAFDTRQSDIDGKYMVTTKAINKILKEKGLQAGLQDVFANIGEHIDKYESANNNAGFKGRNKSYSQIQFMLGIAKKFNEPDFKKIIDQ